MLIACTQCDAQHEFPEERLGEQILQVRCARCGHVFGIRRPAPVVEEPASFELDLALGPEQAEAPPTDEAAFTESTIGESATGDDLAAEPFSGPEPREDAGEETDVQVPPPESPESTEPSIRRSVALPILLLLLLSTAGFVAYGNLMNPGVFKLFKPEFLTGLFQSAPGDALTLDKAQKGAYIEREDGKSLFVITGWVRNDGSTAQGPVKVTGAVFNGAKKLASTDAICGVMLTEEELAALNPAEIAKRLSATPGPEARIKPGGNIAFMIVFTNPPKGINQHSVEVAP